MIGLKFKIYEKEIEVIKSNTHIAYMGDEIERFVKKCGDEANEPVIVCLLKLKEALEKKYSVSDKYDRMILNEKFFTPYNMEKSNILQDISDLINEEIYIAQNIVEDKKVQKFFTPHKTFFSRLSESCLNEIARQLIKEDFLKAKQESDFCYTFLSRAIADAKPMSWLPRHNNNPDNISLATLLIRLSPDETTKDYKQVYFKAKKLFSLPDLKPTSIRSFETSLRLARKKYENSEPSGNSAKLLSIIKPIIASS
jgi:hypothetical protein